MPGSGYANHAAGDGDFRNKYSKGGAGTDGKAPHGHVVKSGGAKGEPKHGSHGKKGHGGQMKY